MIEDFTTIVVHVASEKTIPSGLQEGSLADSLYMDRGWVSRQELEEDLMKANIKLGDVMEVEHIIHTKVAPPISQNPITDFKLHYIQI